MRFLDTRPAGAAARRFAAMGVVLLAATTATLVGGCHLPVPEERAVLHISSGGAFTLDGRKIDPAGLKAAVAAHAASGAGLMVEVRASPAADMQLVASAIETLKQSKVHIAFAREDGTP